MAEKTFAGKTVEVTDEGYLVNRDDWTKEMAVEIAKEQDAEFNNRIKQLEASICCFIREEFGNMNFETDKEAIDYVVSFLDA